MAWQEGMADWKPLSELFSVPESGAPPLPVRPAPAAHSKPIEVRKTSGLAIASLVCGVLSIFTCLLTGVPSIILGHVALSKGKASGGAIKGMGMAIAGLIMGYLSLVGFIFVMFTVGVPAYKRGVDRSKTMMDVAKIMKACNVYASNHDGRYPDSLEVLVKEGAIKNIAPDNYEYFGATLKTDAPSDAVVLMSDWEDEGGKRIVAYSDGRVRVEAPSSAP